jgi:hypothetical protein
MGAWGAYFQPESWLALQVGTKDWAKTPIDRELEAWVSPQASSREGVLRLGPILSQKVRVKALEGCSPRSPR